MLWSTVRKTSNYLRTVVLWNGKLSSCRVSHIVLRQGRTAREGARCKYSVCWCHENNTRRTTCFRLSGVFISVTPVFFIPLGSADRISWRCGTAEISDGQKEKLSLYGPRGYMGGADVQRHSILTLHEEVCHPHAPAAAFLGTEPTYPLNGRQGEPQRRFDRFGEGKSFVSGRIRKPDCPASSSYDTDVWQYCLVLLSRC